jgi:hypothetical protein
LVEIPAYIGLRQKLFNDLFFNGNDS